MRLGKSPDTRFRVVGELVGMTIAADMARGPGSLDVGELIANAEGGRIIVFRTSRGDRQPASAPNGGIRNKWT